jgi:tetratricopeptide (TPR) repeat protein
LRLRRQNGDQQAIAESLSNIGFANYYSGSYDNAMKYFDQALQIHEGLGDKRILATSLNNMASAYERLGRYDKALQCHERSLQLRRQLNIPSDTARRKYRQMNWTLGSYDRAMSYFSESLDIQETWPVSGIDCRNSEQYRSGLRLHQAGLESVSTGVVDQPRTETCTGSRQQPVEYRHGLPGAEEIPAGRAGLY